MIVGIDLGTTHSLIGVYGEQGPRLFPNALGDYLTPSVVSIDESGHILIGQAARDRLISHPQHSVAAFKRWMGSARETRLGERTFRPEELSALVLRSLLADAEAALGAAVTEAVISVPAYFSDAQRRATRSAGELAGIRVERLINEPTAAALAYGLREQRDGSRFLVFDLGGGTFDVSILEMFDGVVEVHASAGDNFLGGEDFLDVLQNACLSDAGVASEHMPIPLLAQLRQKLERLKHELGRHGQAELDWNDGRENHHWMIDEAGFARLSEPLSQRLRTPLERAMRDARLSPEQLDEIILVGGASRMPLVARLVARMFGRLPLRHVNPDQGVALGAAVAAGLKARDLRLDEVILTDVCPYTLGTHVARRLENGQIQRGLYSPIIQRNSVVPVSREDTFYPMQDQQNVLELEIYQGESPLVENNIRLGALTVPLPPQRAIAENAVSLRFTYDINGVLLAEATVRATGERHELLLQQNPGLLDEAELRRRLDRLAELKLHPRGKQENIAMLARAERLYEEHLEARPQLQEWIARFRQVLESQDENRIRQHRQSFGEALEQFEAQV